MNGASGRTKRATSRREAVGASREVRLLLQAALAIHRPLRPEMILHALVRSGMRLTGASAGLARLEGGSGADRTAQIGHRKASGLRPVFRRGGPAAGRALPIPDSYLSNEPALDPNLDQKLRRSLGIHNLLATSIRARGGRFLGAFELHNTIDRRPFDENDARLARSLAEMAAIALENRRAVAERTRARSDLALAHRESEGMFEGIQQPALILDGDHRILAANRAMTRASGRSRRDLVGRRCGEVVRGPEETCASCRRAEGGAPARRANVTTERTIGKRTFLVSCMPIRDAAGEVNRIFQVATDITERRRVDRELSREQERARSYLQIAGVMIVAIDSSRKVTLANRRACEILGYAESEIVGRNWFDHFVPPRERDRVRAAFDALMRGELAPHEYFDNSVLTRDGQERIIAWHNAILRDGEGRISGTLSSGTDVTEIRRADRELRLLNETLEERVAERTATAEERARQLRILARELSRAELRERQRIARLLHEHFQQHLVAARMHLGLLAREPPGNRQHQLIQTIDGILKESIEDSRSLAVGLCPPVLYELGLGPALEWLAGRMREMHGLQVEVERFTGRDPNDPNVRAFVFEAVQELLFNVVKHARAAWATVRLRRLEDDLLQVEVADAGIGFRPERVPNLEADSAEFGLFSIQERLASMGGSTQVDSAPGRGTRVVLCVPLVSGAD